jgi:AAA15 family ATPase/GTPase
MRLNRVAIKNYRSIKDLQIKFDPACRILVGINESGKTNILDALNLLDQKTVSARRDLREPGLREDQITEAYVRFIFNFSPEEASEMTENVKTQIVSRTFNSPIIKLGQNDYTLKQFCKSREGIYVADLLTNLKWGASWGLGDADILGKWKKVGPACPADFWVSKSDSEKILLKPFKLVDTAEFTEIPAEYLDEATPEDLRTLVAAFIKAKVEGNLPKVLFWNYDEKNLLPPRINLDQFCANPDVCLPLKRMFQLYNITDVKKEVTAAKAGSSNTLNNLLRRVAEKTSTHFHSTWREYEGIRFYLAMDGPELVAQIEDESNQYELSQRSDGFKRFVTFLLMVSAEDESNLLKDTLLLIDEPEIGLHPTGARYLMDELIDISRHNYVVFSTHSIFMVDNKIIKRHLIIRKKNEITEAEEVSESNIQDEEVIYKSLGHSIFSNLKEKNLIFEGWRDKKLFETAISRVPAEYEDVKKLKTLGRCFAQGVKQIKNITPLFEAGDRKCLILSDNDSMSREHQRDYQNGRGYGIWRRFDEVIAGTIAITGEDFVKEAAFKEAIGRIAEKYNIPPLPLADLTKPGGRLGILKQWLIGEAVAPEEAGSALEMVKASVFDNLKHSEIKLDYYDYLRGILNLADVL